MGQGQADWLDEKQALPPPIPSSYDTGNVSADEQHERERHRTRRLIVFSILAIIGWNLVVIRDRSLQAAREAYERVDREHERVHVNGYDPDARGKLTVKQAEELFLTVPNESSAIRTSKDYSTIPHIAGSPQDLKTAKAFLEHLQQELGVKTDATDEAPIYDAGSPESQDATLGMIKRAEPSAWIDKYYPVLNYPLGRALDILDDDGIAIWKANVEEVEEPDDPAGEYARTIGAWHGLSKGGDVRGKLVWANYGRKKDFDDLVANGADLNGTIALVRYGGVFRGLKVKAAQEAGCIGTLIYDDPRDHGYVTTAHNGYLPYPHGPAMNPDSIQRGSVQFLSMYPGDPTTPGKPAYKNATRLEGDELVGIPSIPSLPISWRNARRLFEELGGVGKSGDEELGWEWESEGWKLDGKKSERAIRLLNQVDDKVIPIWNAYGVIPGHIKDEVVILGNHRDAWVTGAADPSSGTVAAIEIIRGLGTLLRRGWRPLRTILIASWDAEEFGLVGSTEYGEDFPDFLKKHVVAYLNVDVASKGTKASFSGSPSLAPLIRSVAQSIAHPTDSKRTLWDARDDAGPYTNANKSSPLVDAEAEIRKFTDLGESKRRKMEADPNSLGVAPLGSGSDFTVFLQRIGLASMDGGFQSTRSDSFYHYHSVYDSHRYQQLYADPGFHRHVTWAKFLGTMTIKLADAIVLPINTTQYSMELESYLDGVQALAQKTGLADHLRLKKLHEAITRVQNASRELDTEKAKAEKALRKAFHDAPNEKAEHHQDYLGRTHDLKEKKRKLCMKRKWRAVKPWIKSVFGFAPPMFKTTDTTLGTSAVKASKAKRSCVKKLPLSQFLWSSSSTEQSAPPHKDPRTPDMIKAGARVQAINARLKGFESGFIAKEGGIKDREWYRHLGVAPGKWKGYGATTFPALSEALDERDVERAKSEVERLVERLETLAKYLKL